MLRPRALLTVFLLCTSFAFADVPESEPNNTSGDADPFPIGEFLRGNATTVYDVDWFRFDGQAGMQIRLQLRHTGSFLGTSDFGLWLYGPGPSFLAFSDSPPSGNFDLEEINYTLTSNGVHYVMVDLTLWYSIANAYFIETFWLNQPTPTPTITPTPTVTWTPWVPQTSVETGWEVYR